MAAGAHALGKSVVTFTGYTFEELHRRAAADPWTARLLDLTDLLIDGPYVEELARPGTPVPRQLNQRLLDHAAPRPPGGEAVREIWFCGGRELCEQVPFPPRPPSFKKLFSSALQASP